MIIRRYEVYFVDTVGEVLLDRYFRRKRALEEVRILIDNYRIPALFRDRKTPYVRRTKAFLHGH
jgi:hypothetical protein